MARGNLFDLGALRSLASNRGERVDDSAGVRGALSEVGWSALRSRSKRRALDLFQGGLADQDRGPVSRGRERSPGAGRADGVAERAARRTQRERRPSFDRDIAPGGYEWFYLDGVSDDGAWGIVLIAMLGNPFSPAYAKARRAGGPVNPLAYSALNVGVYNRDCGAWALTERTVDAADRTASSLQIGQSSMRWEGDRLVVDVRERAPWTRRPITGRVVFTPDFTTDQRLSLDLAGRHSWWPVAPSGRLEVRLTEPNVSFSARGYHDSNAGDESLSAGFREWTWSRAHVGDRSFITYDVELAACGTRHQRAMSIGRDGLRDEENLVTVPMSRTRWGIPRSARSESGHQPRVVMRLEDTPFYSRDVITTKMGGQTVRAMHETFSGTRLAMKPVEFLLPFRMRRV